tara:strand:+ start:359 stop:694 length:336 start_codon:yes stop_codon:yes gene_type:complete
MKIFVDIDETICYNKITDKSKARDYSKSVPIEENIKAINRLYNQGHKITYWTARGTMTGIDWFDLTKEQLILWGAKHHDLLLGKPAYDLYIDDKSINTRSWEEAGRCAIEL